MARQKAYDELVAWFGVPRTATPAELVDLHQRIMRIINGVDVDPRKGMAAMMPTIAQASIAVEQAMRTYLAAGDGTGTPGGMLYILADLCRARAEQAHAAGEPYGTVAQWTLWAERVIAGMR